MTPLYLTQGFYLRQALQLLLLFTYFQLTISSETIIKAINDQLKVFGKFKFTHFVHDLGLRCCTVSVLFSFGLLISALVPLIAPCMLLLFTFIYAVDKYNLIFVYPIEFDSQITNRETLVKSSVLAVLTFQAVMLLMQWDFLQQNYQNAIGIAILIQVIGLLFAWKYLRKPWQGLPQKEEEYKKIENERLFEDISSF